MQPLITFTPVDPPGGTSVTARLGNGFAVPSADGGWSVVSRPRQVGMTDWQGTSPVTMDIPILIDEFVSNKSIEHTVMALYGIMRNRVGERNEPAVIRIAGVPIPFYGAHWVITGIAPSSNADDEIRRSSDGHRVRAAMTVTVTQYVPGSVTVTTKSSKTSPSKKAKSSKSAGATKSKKTSSTKATKPYVVKDGDTLSKIAAKLLGNSNKWPSIAKLNNLRDPDFITPGEKLKIPS